MVMGMRSRWNNKNGRGGRCSTRSSSSLLNESHRRPRYVGTIFCLRDLDSIGHRLKKLSRLTLPSESCCLRVFLSEPTFGYSLYIIECLVHFIEPLFFVVALNEIETASLERIQFTLKQFYSVLVFKDFTKAPLHINSTPSAQLDGVENWLEYAVVSRTSLCKCRSPRVVMLSSSATFH